MWLVLAAGFTLGWAQDFYSESRRLDVRIDVQAPPGHRLRLRINGERFFDPIAIPPGRSVLRIEGVPGRIRQLAIELPDSTGKDVTFYGIQFTRGGHRLGALTADDLAQFARRRLRLIRFVEDREGIVFRTTPGSSRLEQRFDGKLAMGRAGPTWPAPKPAVLLVMLVVAGVVFVVLSCPRELWIRDTAWWGASVLAAVALAYGVSRAASGLDSAPPVASRTIGQAGFSGFSPHDPQRAMLLGIGATALVGFAAVRLRPAAHATAATGNGPLTTTEPSYARCCTLGLVFVGVIVALPDTSSLRARLMETPQPSHFDARSQTTWQYMLSNGAVPFRDFWYPYSGQYLSALPWDTGLAWRFAHRLTVVLVFGGCLWRLLGGRIGWIAAPVIVALWGVYVGALQATERYLLCVMLVLALGLVLVEQARWKWLAFAGLAGYVAFYEFPQLIYAAPGFLVLLAAKWRLHSEERNRLIGSMAAAMVCFCALVGIQIAVLSANDQWSGYWSFVTTLPDQVHYSSQAVDPLTWFGLPRDREGLLLLLTLVLVPTSVAFVCAGSRKRRLEHFIPLALALVTAMVFQKMLMRPGIASQLFVVPLVGLFLMAYFVSGSSPPRLPASLWAAGFAGYFLFVGGVSSGFGREVIASFTHVPFNAGSVFRANAAEMEFIKAHYFSPHRYHVGDLSGFDMRNWLGRYLGGDDTLFVLGDEAYAYVVMERDPPPYVTLYNQSLRSSQEEQLAWIEKRKPRFVLWRPHASLSDSVPEHVRVPLVFNYVVAHYVPVTEASGFHLLRRRQRDEEAAFAFFTKWLGERVDLGFVPSASGAPTSELDRCDRAGCSKEFVVVQTDKPVHGRSRSVRFDVDDMSFTVEFSERRGVSRYFIRTDRLWFYGLALSENLSPVLRPPHERDLVARIRDIPLSEDVLY